MINANGTNPGKYISGINGIINKVKTENMIDSQKNLFEYQGFYSPMPWQSEVFFSSWNGELVSLDLPADNPGEAMTFYKHIEGDTFRRIRDDQELGETLVFERDGNDRVFRFISHGNYSIKIKADER
jgi:hypothetical protein